MKVRWFCEYCGGEFTSAKRCAAHEKECPKRVPDPAKKAVYKVSLDRWYSGTVDITHIKDVKDDGSPCPGPSISITCNQWYSTQCYREGLVEAVDRLVACVIKALTEEAVAAKDRIAQLAGIHQDALARAKEIMGKEEE